MYAAAYKEMSNSLQPSRKKSGEEGASQAEQTNAEREREHLKMSAV
jgi:hypothetical protein